MGVLVVCLSDVYRVEYNCIRITQTPFFYRQGVGTQYETISTLDLGTLDLGNFSIRP